LKDYSYRKLLVRV